MTKAEFLSKLADEARGSLSVELTQELVCEVAGHLDESIQSRLELGEPPEVAEINAVAGFARPEQFLRSMEVVHEPASPYDKVLLRAGLGFLLVLTFWANISTQMLGWPFFWVTALVGPLAVVLVRSWRLGTFRWGTFRNLSLASAVLIAGVQPLLTLNLWAYGGMGFLPALGSSNFTAEWRAALQPEPDLVLRSPEAESYAGFRSPETIQNQLDATARAIQAPVVDRYRASWDQSVMMTCWSIGFLFVMHAVPVAFRRRMRKLWRPSPVRAVR